MTEVHVDLVLPQLTYDRMIACFESDFIDQYIACTDIDKVLDTILIGEGYENFAGNVNFRILPSEEIENMGGTFGYHLFLTNG